MTYDTTFISDVHLGTERCNTQKLLGFLKELKDLYKHLENIQNMKTSYLSGR